eukprot:scaffold2798_cov87-Skeletonema_marinoi.AAC.3
MGKKKENVKRAQSPLFKIHSRPRVAACLLPATCYETFRKRHSSPFRYNIANSDRDIMICAYEYNGYPCPSLNPKLLVARPILSLPVSQ